MRKSFIALAALSITFAGTPAFAGEIQVKTNDLNLASIEGQEALNLRIVRASKQVCGYDELKTGTRTATPDMRRCFAKAKSSASAQMAALVDERRLGG